MSVSMRGLAVTAIMAAAAGFGGVWLGLAVIPPQSPPSLHEVLHDRLDLSAEQLNQIEALEQTYAARKQARELEMRAANAELAAAMREEHTYGPRVAAAIEHAHDAMGRYQTDTVEHVFAMRAVLNEEQAAIFDDVVAANLTTDVE